MYIDFFTKFRASISNQEDNEAWSIGDSNDKSLTPCAVNFSWKTSRLNKINKQE